jgi:hypothetical protein
MRCLLLSLRGAPEGVNTDRPSGRIGVPGQAVALHPQQDGQVFISRRLDFAWNAANNG